MTRIWRAVRAILVATILMIADAAWADSFTFCFKYDTNYADALTGTMSDGTYPARGAQLRLVRNSDGVNFTHYMDDTGCKTLTLAHESWTVRLDRKALLGNGHIVEVRQDGTGSLYSGLVTSSFTPTNGGSQTWHVGTSDPINIMAAGTYAVYNNPGSLIAETWSFRDGVTNCTGTPGGCWDVDTKTINIGVGAGALASYKFGIVHELGHAMTDRANGYLGFAKSYAATTDACPGNVGFSHSMPSKEYNSGAAVEAIAHFYSALTFNPGGGAGTDCTIQKHYAPDWNQDGATAGGEVSVFSCESGVPAASPAVGSGDYYWQFCEGSGEDDNRGTEYDWLRMFWDLYTDKAVSWATILNQWALANPDDWNEDGDAFGLTYPSSRMSEAADSLGFQADYDAVAAYNGTDR